MTADKGTRQVATGTFIAQAAGGGVAVTAERLILDLGGDLPQKLRDELLRRVSSVVDSLAESLVVENDGNIVGNAKRFVLVDAADLRSILADYSRRFHGTPNQLPIDLSTFTGRTAALARLAELTSAESVAKLICISGMGGVGKSALAVHFAHKHLANFPDGVLWANVRAQSIDSVLNSFAREFGVDLGAADKHAKASMVRSILAERRALVILDNADQTNDLELMIPAGGSCLTIVTTRRPQLHALDSADRIELDVFSEQEVASHFRSVFDAPPDDPSWLQDAQLIAGLCGRLPLALDISARLFKRMAISRSEFAAMMAAVRPRTRLLDDRDRSLNACFDMTWAQLDREQRRLLGSAAVLEGATFDVKVLAHLIESRSPLTVRLAAGELVDFSILGINEAGRYFLHPLVRDYALAKVGEDDPAFAEVRRRWAIEHYLDLVRQDWLGPEQSRDRYDRTRVDLDNALAAWRWALGSGIGRVAIDFARALTPLLFGEGHWAVCDELLSRTVDTLDGEEDVEAVFGFRLRLGELCQEMADYNRAAEYLDAYIGYYSERGDRTRVSDGVRELAELRRVQRDFPEALRLHQECLALRVAEGNLGGQAQSLHDCGLTLRICGRYDEATDALERAIAIAREIGHRVQESYSTMELGILARLVGDGERADRLLRQSLNVFRRAHDKRGQAYALRELGNLALDNGEYPEAIAHHEEGLQLRKDLGDRRGEAVSYHCLGRAHQVVGDFERARRYLEDSLALTNAIADPKYSALNQVRLGEAAEHDGDLGRAREYWQEGLATMERLGLVDPELELAREHLARTG